ncbi:MAG: AAA family ATPase [Candidatus Thermoplasmatota archaeon]|nr:AAA family ATPase [Candidatus Thermoplasmatota archaeon]
MRVVATTGMPGSGKSLAMDVAREVGIPVISMGDLVRQEAEAQGLPDEPASYGKVAGELREREGKGAWANRTLEHLGDPEGGALLIDGVRNLDEVDIFREAFGPDFCLLAILASPATRYARMAERGRGEDSEEEAVLRERDRRELGYGLGAAIAMADIYVENEADPEEAKSTLRAVLAASA